MPCDTNGDGLASLRELADYVTDFRHPYFGDSTMQHVQAYPADSDYALFMQDDATGE